MKRAENKETQTNSPSKIKPRQPTTNSGQPLANRLNIKRHDQTSCRFPSNGGNVPTDLVMKRTMCASMTAPRRQIFEIVGVIRQRREDPQSTLKRSKKTPPAQSCHLITQFQIDMKGISGATPPLYWRETPTTITASFVHPHSLPTPSSKVEDDNTNAVQSQH